jgi:hypothetical protein
MVGVGRLDEVEPVDLDRAGGEVERLVVPREVA